MNETGPDRIRDAIRRDRGGDAPQHRIPVCGLDCRGEITSNPDLGPNHARYCRGRRDWLDSLICPGCIRFKFNPIHWFNRLVGICDGQNCC